ncbi:MAG: tetratricopeptide repeat protein [Bacteroidota bacterium]
MRRIRNFKFIFIGILLFLFCGTLEAQKKKKNKGLSEREKIAYTNYFMEGQKQKMIENIEEALEAFQKALNIVPNDPTAKYEVARIYFDQKRVEDCQNAMLDVVKVENDNEWYNALLAQTYMAQNNLEPALKLYEKILNDHPDKKDYLFEIANINLYLGKNKEALETFDRIEESFGMSDEILREKLALYDQMGKTQDAIDLLEDLSKKFPANPFYSGMLAEYYNRTGDGQKGKEKFEEILENDPANGMAHLSLHDIFMKEGEQAKAMGHLREAIESDDLGVDLKMNVLLNYYAYTESDKNILPDIMKVVEAFVAKHNDEAKAHAVNGDFLLRENQTEKARQSFIKAVELAPDKTAIWSQVLALDFELRKFEEMIKHTDECLELFPTNSEYYYFNGLALNQNSDHEKAIDILNSGKELVFDNKALKVDFWSLLGDSYNAIRDYKNSDKSFDAALKIDPENALILNNYSYFLSLRKEELNRAEEMITKALNQFPSNASFLDTYAWVLFQNEKYEEARQQIEKAILNGAGSSGTVVEHLGDILYKLGDEAMALEKWEEAKRLGETSESIEKKIKEGKYFE